MCIKRLAGLAILSIENKVAQSENVIQLTFFIVLIIIIFLNNYFKPWNMSAYFDKIGLEGR